MKMTWKEVDEIAARCGAQRVMVVGPLGRAGFSFKFGEICFIDVGGLDPQDLEHELLIRK